MAIDTSRTIEIEASPAEILGFVLAGAVLTAINVALAFGLLAGERDDAFTRLIGYAGIVFFGAATLVLIWRLFTMRGPIVTINPEGIRDTRVAAEIIPWRAVIAISTWQTRNQKAMVLAVERAVERKLTLTRMARLTRTPDRALGADGLCIMPQGLKIDYDTLLATSEAYVQAAKAAAKAH